MQYHTLIKTVQVNAVFKSKTYFFWRNEVQPKLQHRFQLLELIPIFDDLEAYMKVTHPWGKREHMIVTDNPEERKPL
jgi:hypothetical protein